MSRYENGQKVLIAGGGIVGLCCAYHLTKLGYKVTVVDRDSGYDGASYGNAGAIAAAEVLPFAGPGLLLKVPRWLFDPVGPLSIRWTHLHHLLPWLYLFLRSGTRIRSEAGARALASLLVSAIDDHQHILQQAGLTDLLQSKGALYVYRSKRGQEAEESGWNLRNRLGVRFTKLDRAALQEYEPDLGPLANGGYYVESFAHYSDPRALVVGLLEMVERMGVRLIADTVKELDQVGTRVTRVRTNKGAIFETDNLIIAAGAWSSALSKRLGEPFPLESERGYNTTISNPGVDISNYVAFVEDHFVMSPLSVGLRIGGAVELAGLKPPPNYDRCRALVKLGQRYVPNLKIENGRQWMGHRPSTPDSLPVISRSVFVKNAFYAFGHGHLGLTLSATTGRILADLVSGGSHGLDLTPFRIDRFTEVN